MAGSGGCVASPAATFCGEEGGTEGGSQALSSGSPPPAQLTCCGCRQLLECSVCTIQPQCSGALADADGGFSSGVHFMCFWETPHWETPARSPVMWDVVTECKTQA